ncbi:C2 domain-containing family protein [Salix suchowensis]|nr:C2 domain-containing family protein [Salix suchowensis]
MAVGILEVQLVNAKGLRDTDFFGDMDPYVIVQYKSQERKSGVARGQGGHPVWNERLTFKVEYPGQGSEYKLSLNIMDKDTFSSDDFIGGAKIYVKDLLTSGVQMELPSYIPASTEWLMLANHMLGRLKLVSLLPSRRNRYMMETSTADGMKAVLRSAAVLSGMNFLC